MCQLLLTGVRHRTDVWKLCAGTAHVYAGVCSVKAGATRGLLVKAQARGARTDASTGAPLPDRAALAARCLARMPEQ